MNANLIRELVEDFIIEAREHFDGIEESLLELEKNPSDEHQIRNVFRAFHTIKGNASLLKLTDIITLSHKAENMLAKIRDEGRPADSATIDVILQISDILKNMISHVEKGEVVEYDLTEICEKIDQEVNKAASPPPSPAPPSLPPTPPAPPARLEQSFPQPASSRPEMEKKTSIGRVHISTIQVEDTHFVKVAGNMDTKGMDILLKELIGISDKGFNKIVLDMEQVPLLSCCGLGGIWAEHQNFRSKNGALRLAKLQGEPRKILELTDLLGKLEIFDSVEEAARGF